MISKIVHKLEPITLVGGGDVSDPAFEQALQHAPSLVAADGGAQAILQRGKMPEAVIGDMDSLSGDLKASLSKSLLHEVTEQDSTDFEKCLMRIAAPLIIGIGFLGGRIDHQLAAFHALVRFPNQPCVLLGDEELVFLCPPKLDLPLVAGTPVSLFPMQAVTAQGLGLTWSFEQLDLAPGVRIGTSNRAEGAISLSATEAALLCILPAECLEAVVTALRAQRDLWPALA